MAEDPYMLIRCPVCGVPWAEHPKRLDVYTLFPEVGRKTEVVILNICADYDRFSSDAGQLPKEVGLIIASNTPGHKDKRTLKYYPGEVCPPAHLRSKATSKES